MLTVGIIGGFDPISGTHLATNQSLSHAAQTLGVGVTRYWLPTADLTRASLELVLEPFHALWAAPGSPYKSMNGALLVIQFARERGWPFFGT